MYKDDLILGDLYLENAQVTNLTEDQQKKLASFIVNLVVKSDQGDREALRILSMSPDEIAGMMSQGEAVQTEAFENIRSKIGGVLGGSGSIQTRYNLLKTNLSKILWELGEDIKTTRSQEAIGKYDALTNALKNIDPALIPQGGMFQKAAYSIGKGVGTVGKVVAGGALAKVLLTVGLPAAAVGGIMGGVLNVLKHAQNTQITPAEKIKKALKAAGLGAVLGFAMGELRDLIGGGEASGVENSSTSTYADTDSFFADKELVRSTVEDYLTQQDPNITNVEILDNGYIRYDSPNGEGYIEMTDLEQRVDGIVQPPGNTLAGYILNQIRNQN